ncbi:hypothetical protein VIGAN_04122800 [Vigna angularis var. angularis]|uniref:Tubby C-terminal domain-containing protein n=1 Tax=Vigna angularis var. angularis TaxID=157739 RepID=A0A0S3RTP8_PHAAN|nr:hypothetical protein VIGAN_04122800 [Vigna angularis var. angularis]
MTAPVIDVSYCNTQTCTIRINTERGVAYDENRDFLFHIKKTLLSPHNRRVLYDKEKPIVSFYSKILKPQGRCKVFRGERNDPSQLLFSVKKVNNSSNIPDNTTLLNVFLANNNEEIENNFRVIIGGRKESCTVYAGEYISDNDILAHMRNNGDFDVTVYPNVDYAFIVALLMIVKDINCSTHSITQTAYKALKMLQLSLSSLASAKALVVSKK